MGGVTTSSDPGVIAAHEQDRARHALEARVLRLHGIYYPYIGPSGPPSGAQVDATITALRVLLRSPEYRPIVLAALGIDNDEGRVPR